ncbi:hypothetical protein M427DRAFT_139140 [Gonapodya prolifera JEL478]|uniref:Uncharacterized protein n=1 Tax=Gonapodya prolifera (strain JEL478) TaxID=1344416 RepID=A0A139A295_GONPJ|nr:hypothetical protein M427DRAFT_139140 [Gonapodya prolifera JEL478]|eukprot:KXS10665.1 hypothetical protein M427DRAFT_139140 [Gonapodya prolifera JEL478]
MESQPPPPPSSLWDEICYIRITQSPQGRQLGLAPHAQMVCVSRREAVPDSGFSFGTDKRVVSGSDVFQDLDLSTVTPNRNSNTNSATEEQQSGRRHLLTEYAEGFEEVVQHAIEMKSPLPTVPSTSTQSRSGLPRPYFTETPEGWRYDISAAPIVRLTRMFNTVQPIFFPFSYYATRYITALSDGSGIRLVSEVAQRATQPESYWWVGETAKRLKRLAEEAVQSAWELGNGGDSEDGTSSTSPDGGTGKE